MGTRRTSGDKHGTETDAGTQYRAIAMAMQEPGRQSCSHQAAVLYVVTHLPSLRRFLTRHARAFFHDSSPLLTKEVGETARESLVIGPLP